MLHLLSCLRVLTLEIREAQLHFALRFNQVLPRFPLLDMEGLNRSVAQHSEIILGRTHTAIVRHQSVRTAIFGQSRKQHLQYCREVLMRRPHPRQHLPRISFEYTEAVDPAPIKLDKRANIRAPQGMAVHRAIGEMFEAGAVRLRGTGTLPGTRSSVELAIDRHRTPHGALTRGGSSRC